MAPIPEHPVERFMRHISVEPSGCWVWTAHRDRKGYASQIELIGGFRPKVTHFALAWFRKTLVPDGWHADHLCRNVACVNPWHLEPVTATENDRRRDAARSIYDHTLYCTNGHLRAESMRRAPSGQAYCKECQVERNRRKRHANVRAGLSSKGTPRKRTTALTPDV